MAFSYPNTREAGVVLTGLALLKKSVRNGLAVDKMVGQLGLPNGVKHDTRHTLHVFVTKVLVRFVTQQRIMHQLPDRFPLSPLVTFPTISPISPKKYCHNSHNTLHCVT